MLALWLAGAALALDSESHPLFSGMNTPYTIGARNGAVGLFRPATVGLGDDWEVQVNGLAVFLGPQVDVKHTVFAGDDGVAFAVGGELALPRPLAGMLQTGPIQVIAGDQQVRWTAVPGVSAFVGWRADRWVVSGRARLRGGVPLQGQTGRDLTFQDISWVDPWLAPQAAGFSAQVLGRVDWLPKPGWAVSAQGRVELVGGPDFSGRLLALGAWGDHLAGGFGWAGALSRHSDGYPDLNPETPKMAPVIWLDGIPVFDIQGRW